MNVPALRAPTIRVPGLLTDEALQEQLKQFTAQQNAGADLNVPSSASDMAEKVQQDFVTNPIRRTMKLAAPLAGPFAPVVSLLSGVGANAPAVEESAQQRLVNRRSDILSGSAAGRALVAQLLPGAWLLSDDGVLGKLGALSPEAAAAEQAERVEAAKQEEQAVRSAADARRQLRNLTDEQATAMGLPVAPGTFDAETVRQLDEQDQRRQAFEQRQMEEAAADTAAAESTPPTQAWWLNAARSAYKGVTGMATSTARGAVLPLEMVLGDGERSDVRAWIDTVDATIEKMLPGDKAQSRDFLTKLSAGGGSFLGFMVGGMVASAIGLPVTTATFVMGALSGGADQFTDAERFGASGTQKLMAYLFGMGLGATEAIPINNALMRLETATGGVVSRLLQNTAASSMEEFIQELGQSVGSDVVAQAIYDENRSVDWAGAFENAAVGGILGALMGGSISALKQSGVLRTREEPVQEPAEQDRVSIIDQFLEQVQTQFDAATAAMEAEIDASSLTAVDEAAATVATAAPAAVAAQLVERAATEQRPATTVADEFAASLQRPPLFDYAEVQARGGTVPAPAEDGTITLRHYAREQRDVLDPAMRGTGPLRGVERARLVGEDAVDRVYYGVRSEEDFRPPAVDRAAYTRLSPEERAALRQLGGLGVNENTVRGALEARYREEARRAGYQPEGGLGDIVHEVKVRPDELYNMRDDVLNLREQVADLATANERLTRMERLARDAGFKGAYFPDSPLGATAILFEAAKPSRVVNRRYGLPVEEIAGPEDFATPTAEAFQKGGWAIVTATREAAGPHDAPENVAANERLRKRLKRDGVQFVEVSDAYRGEPQGESFLIFAPEAYARRLGQQFGQESVLTRRGLEYSDGRLTPVDPAQTVVGEEARGLDFFSQTPDGTAFSLGLDFGATFNETVRREIEAVELDALDLAPLPGNTSGRPIESVVRAARAYAEANGLPIRRQATYVRVDPERGARIAAAYEAMEHAPNDPAVAAAYQAMIDETLAQYQYVKATGLVVEAIEPGMPDPYPEGPKQVLEDLQRGHLWFFPTDQGFGTLTEAEATNPLLAPTDEFIGERQLLANDVFRIVHDFFGHGIEGSGFGARGEENAWQSHMRLYSEAALPAVTSETRGQNSWVNFGPYGEHNRSNQRETVYADQKTGIMPEWTWREGVADEFFEANEDVLLGMRAPDETHVQRLMNDVPGYAGVAPYLTAEERSNLRRASAQRIVDIFETLPSAEETAAVALAGRAKRGWYARSARTIVEVFGVADAPRFAALLAALSPQVSVESNAINALRVWTAWVKAGRPTEERRIRQIMALNVQGSGGEASVLPAWVPNSVRALTAPVPEDIVLSGPKVDSFMRNLRGEVNEVTNDTWMANYALVPQTLLQGVGAPVKRKGPGYKAFSAMVRAAAQAASEITGETWTPAEIQETVWSWAKAAYEKSSSLQVSVEELTMAGGLTEADIASTPDFATLFTSGVFRRILEEGGYDLADVEAVSGRADGGAGAGGRPAPAEGSAADDGAFEQHVREAARRLDALREQRAQEEGREESPGQVAEEAPTEDFSDADLDGFFATVADSAHDGSGSPVGTESFRRWFGDSKVVDAAGEPLVVYHGSKSLDGIREFKTDTGVYGQGLVWFSPSKQYAASYARPRFGGSETGEAVGKNKKHVIPVYLRVTNPFFGDLRTLPEGGTVAERLVAAGFDAYIPFEKREKPLRDVAEIAVVDPTQIKSVNNSGAFDPANPDILAMSTAANRGAYRGEPQRPQGGVPGQTTADAGDVKLSAIAANFIKLMDLTARQGRFTLKGSNVMGQYSGRQDVVRLRTPNDLSSLIHEGGHALQARANGPLLAFINGHITELHTVAKALYGGDLSKADSKTKTAEGFAEFFRIYVTNRAFAERKYPELAQAFAAVLDTDPRLRDGLQAIGDQFAAWLQLPSSQLLRNMVVSGQRTGVLDEALEELREGGFTNWMHEIARNSLQASINQNAALNDLVAGVLNIGQREKGKAIDLKAAEDPRVLIRLAVNSGNRGMVQVTDGVMGYRSTTPTTRGLREALLRYHGRKADQSLPAVDPERQADFAAYLIALRGIDEYRRLAEGKIERPPIAATLGDLKVTVQEMNAKYGNDFAEAAQIVHEYGMGLWQKAYDAGLMSKQTYTDGLDRQFYAPLQRDMSDRGPSMSDISGATTARPVKRFRGSDRDIIDPMDALMAKTFAMERVIAENEVKKALAALADKAGKAGALVERVPAHQLLGQEYSVQEVARQLTRDDTMTEADAQDLMTLLEASIEEGNRIALFRSQQALARGENIVFFWEKGKLAALQIKDGDVGLDVVNTLNAIGTENVPLFVDALAYTSSVFRSTITSWPDFLVVNFIRDQVSAWLLTDVGYKPFATGLRGVGDEIRQKDWARQYNAAMGIMGGMNSAALHKARVDRDINALRSSGYVARAFSGEGAAGKIQGLARVTELSETGTRLGIFRKAFEKAKKDGLTDWEASIEASYLATDYIDFGLHGNRMLAHRRLIPFLNAHLQGLYKMMRTLGGDEVRQRRGLRFVLTSYFKDLNGLDLSRRERDALNTGRKAWLKMLSLGLIGAALQFAFEDDPDYQDASEYLRTTGWVIPLGDGRIFYIPKPFELAIVSNFVERAIEHASGDGEAKNRFMRGMAMNLSPPTSPPVIQVLVEQLANFDFFSGRDIVPDHMRALAPELQYSHYTSQFAKQLGDMLGWSPMRIDHALSGMGASAYRDLVQMYNTLDPDRPTSDPTDWPLTRRFVRDARRGAVSSQDFWNYASTTSGSLRRAELTYRRMVEEGRDNAAADFLLTLDEDHKAYALLNAHFKADAKRLNPFYRARQLTTIVSAMRREIPTALGLEDTGLAGGSIILSATEKAEVDEVLSEIARREVRNTLVYSRAPGWEFKKPLPVEPTIELLEAIHPLVAEEYRRRVAKAKVYDGNVVMDYWHEVRDRLVSDGENSFLDDIVTIAEATQ